MGRTAGHLRIGGLLQMGMVPPASITSPSVPQWSLARATAVACPVSWVPELSLGLQSHQPAPWRWTDTKAGGLRLSWHGQNHPIDAVVGTESAADSFVGLGSLFQELVCVGEGAARW